MLVNFLYKNHKEDGYTLSTIEPFLYLPICRIMQDSASPLHVREVPGSDCAVEILYKRQNMSDPCISCLDSA